MNSNINPETIQDFNDKMDELCGKIQARMADYTGTPVVYEIFNDTLNRLEVARRVFNQYAATGEVKNPD